MAQALQLRLAAEGGLEWALVRVQTERAGGRPPAAGDRWPVPGWASANDIAVEVAVEAVEGEAVELVAVATSDASSPFSHGEPPPPAEARVRARVGADAIHVLDGAR